MKKPITSDRAPAPGGPYSAALAVDGWIFLAGQGGTDPVTGSMAERTTVRADLLAGMLVEVTVVARRPR